MTATAEKPLTDGLGPASRAVVEAVLAAWPDHGRFLASSLTGRSAELRDTTEVILDLLVQVARRLGRPLDDYARAYRYLCEKIVFPEELFFRRHGRYRLSSFAEADAEVYAEPEFMARYMDGLFVSDGLWLNHANALNHFARRFLPSLPGGGRHLEIGPGHGLLLHLAAGADRFQSMSAWDISPTSIAHARQVLEAIGEADRVELRLNDLYAPQVLAAEAGRYSTIVLSEVLEHLERPREALDIIHGLLAPGGTLWVNVPANGPAPDHLYLLRTPDEAVELVASAGFEIVEAAAFPVAGWSLERAIKAEMPVSCVVVGRKAGGGA